MRDISALAAAVLAGLAAIVSSQDGSSDLVPFYVGLTFLGGIVAWSVPPPAAGIRRWAGTASALLWILAAIWAGALLLGVAGASSRPPPVPDQTYLGIPATTYRVLGLFGGALLSGAAALVPERRR